MKAIILAGGFGTRISEESHLKPKPMIEIGGMPILWHIMNKCLFIYIYFEIFYGVGYEKSFNIRSYGIYWKILS